MGCDTDGLVTALGDADKEPEAIDTLDAAGCLVASGLNAHHHMFQNLTRAFGPSRRGCAAGRCGASTRWSEGRRCSATGELTLPDVDEMLKRHAEISRSWQGFHA
jgi:hypothetical protein